MTSPASNLFSTVSTGAVLGLVAVLLSCGGGDHALEAEVSAQLIVVFAQAGLENPEPEVQLTGVLPLSVSKASLLGAIENAFPYPVIITDHIEQRASVTSAPWAAPLETAMGGLLNGANSLTLHFSGPSLTVEGVSSSEEDNQAIRTLTIKAFANSIQHVSHRLRVESVKARPSHVSIAVEESGSLTLRGLVPTQFIKERITDAVKHSLWQGNVSIDDAIVVRSYIEEPNWVDDLLSFVPIYFDTPQSRQLYVGNDSVRLGGRVRSDQEKRSLVYSAGRAFLDSDLPVTDSLGVNPLSASQRQQVLARQSLADYVKPIHIYFGSGHYFIDKTERRKLQAVAAKLSITETGERLMIVGLTDSKGDPEINESIKRERCGSVHKALLELGCDESRLILGFEFPAKPDASEPPEKQRRVEFRVVSPSTEDQR